MPAVTFKVQLMHLIGKGPIGIGEDHTVPAARQYVKQLIDAGVVMRLFVEYSANLQGQVDRIKAAIDANPPNVDEINSVKDLLNNLHLHRGNTYSLGQLVVDALDAGVDVWCADGPNGGGARRFGQRHGHVQRNYFQRTRGLKSPRGSVLLFGSNHFDDPNNPLDQFIPNLNYFNF